VGGPGKIVVAGGAVTVVWFFICFPYLEEPIILTTVITDPNQLCHGLVKYITSSNSEQRFMHEEKFWKLKNIHQFYVFTFKMEIAI
jgi:hypothetical protein